MVANWELLWKTKIVPMFYLMYCNWLPSELGLSALFGILDIGALRIDDLDYGGTVTRNMLGVQCLGNEFSSYLGHTLQMVAVVHMHCWHYATLHYCMELNASVFDELLLLSFGCARRHGFWNQVVKAAFRVLNSVVSGTFCRSPARSKSPNASVSFFIILKLNLFYSLLDFVCYKMSMQPANGEAASPKKQSPSRSPSGSRSPDVKWLRLSCSLYC